jgi:hypothetical protein
MKVIGATDRLEPFGILVGAFLVLVGIGSVIGLPWATNDSVVASAIQLIGIAAMIALGIGLARLSHIPE